MDVTVVLVLVGLSQATFQQAQQGLFLTALAAAAGVPPSQIRITSALELSLKDAASTPKGRTLLQALLQVCTALQLVAAQWSIASYASALVDYICMA